jgi:tetratricopeptide (TPR) repeat protein
MRGSAGLLVAAALGCATRVEPDPAYAPTRSVLEVASLLRLHVDDDTYRFEPARDVTGKNVYRSAFARLESLEEIHSDRFASGYVLDVIWFAKARALERLGEFELAARHYQRTAELDSPLAEAARRGRAVCEQLAVEHAWEPEPDAGPEALLAELDLRRARLEALLGEVHDTHYRPVIREELERIDRALADQIALRSQLDPRLDALALQLEQEVVERHRESKRAPRHLLALADFYADLSRRYVRRVPATALDFDPALFDEYAFGATRIYEVVARQDGRVEKLEAARKLEAFLAFTLQVYDERMPQ